MLSELIAEGEIKRLIKKNITVYKQRRDYLSKCLTIHFKDIATWKIPDGGLAIWLEFNSNISLFQLAEKAKANNLFLPKTILYQNKSLCAIRLGFGHLNEDEIEKRIKRLKNSIEEFISNK